MNEKEGVNVPESDAESPAEDGTKNQSKSVTKHDVQKEVTGINGINFFNEKQLLAAENFLTKVMRSDKGGIKSVNEGLAILMRAQDLGLPFSTCIEHIHVINGKTGIDIHIVKALLSRAGCTWRCIKDYQPLYEYTDGFNVYVDGSFPDYVKRCKNQTEADKLVKDNPDQDITYVWPVKWYKDFSGNVYKDYQLNTKQFGIAINKAQADAISKEKRIAVYRVPNVPVDYITEYEIVRNLHGKETSAIGRFTYSDATMAGMFEKDTYKKYPRILIGHRAFTYAAREVASDVLFGVMETTELKIVSGSEINETTDFEDATVVDI